MLILTRTNGHKIAFVLSSLVLVKGAERYTTVVYSVPGGERGAEHVKDMPEDIARMVDAMTGKADG